MRLRIIINDKECTNPIVKYGLAAAAFIGTVAVTGLIIFVILPIIGVSVTVVLGLFIAITVVGSLFSFPVFPVQLPQAGQLLSDPDFKATLDRVIIDFFVHVIREIGFTCSKSIFLIMCIAVVLAMTELLH